MQLFTNNASSRLVAGISNVSLSLQISAGDGAKFPNPTGGDYFLATLSKVTSGIESTVEIVKVTARATDVFTIIRAQEGTSANVYAENDFIQLRMTAASATSTEAHVNSTANPHSVTKTQVGLSNVDNTSDVNKPISTAQQTALDLKAPLASPTFTGVVSGVTEADSTDSTRLATTAFVKSSTGLKSLTSLAVFDLDTATVGKFIAVNGLESDATANHWPSSGLPSGSAVWWNVLTYGTTSRATQIAFFGFNSVQGKMFTRMKHDSTWYAWVEMVNKTSLDLKANLASPTFTGTVAGITASMVGLGNVTNTSDANKPVSTAQQTALDLKAGLVANTFTGSQVLSDQQLSRAMLKDCGLVYVDKGNSSTTTQTLDFTAGSHQKITATGNHTIATSNWPPSGNLGEMLLELVNGAAFTITWPTINWVKSDGSFTTTFSENGVTLQSSGTDFIVLWSRDAGTTIYGKVIR